LIESLEQIQREYHELCHAMQSGVAMWMNYELPPKATDPKHLRVGVNSAMVDSAALASVLIAKGIITEREYYTALRDKMKAEVESYRKLISEHLGGTTVTLR
jgi:hypothetical protein